MDLPSLTLLLSHGKGVRLRAAPPAPVHSGVKGGGGKEEEEEKEGGLSKPGSHCPPAVPAVIPARSVPLAWDVLVLPMSPVSLVEWGKMDGNWGKNSCPPALLRGYSVWPGVFGAGWEWDEEQGLGWEWDEEQGL